MIKDTYSALTNTDHSNGKFSRSRLYHHGYDISGLCLWAPFLLFRCGTDLLQETEYQCSHPNQLSFDYRFYVAGTEMSFYWSNRASLQIKTNVEAAERNERAFSQRLILTLPV